MSIFFGTLLYSLLGQPEAEASEVLLHWAGLPIYYILSYSMFGLFKSVIPEKWLKAISILVLNCINTFLY